MYNRSYGVSVAFGRAENGVSTEIGMDAFVAVT